MKVPSQWGFCFAGNEAAFCEALDVAITSRASLLSPFTYVEIGIGHGGALGAVQEFLTSYYTGIRTPFDFRIIGVDLPNYTGKAYDLPTAKRLTPSELPKQAQRSIALCFVGADDFLKQCPVTPDFLFIDGCHGEHCVKSNFQDAEKLIKPGGVVAFHDTDFACQEMHFQPHCGTGIRARKAVCDLGLMDDTRPGWKKLNETFGDKNRSGHGCLFVQRQ